MKRLILITISILLSSLSWAADQNIYISSSASPGGDGAITTPYDSFTDINWTTGGVNSINDWVTAGDDVYINLKRGDTFSESFNLDTSSESGTASARITFQAYSTGDKPIIQDTSYSVRLVSVDYLTFDNIVFEGNGTSSYGIYTPLTTDPADNVIVTDCEFKNFTIRGINIYSANFYLSDSTFHDNAEGGCAISRSADINVLNNTFYANGTAGSNNHDGLTVYDGCTGFLIQGNTSRDNYSAQGTGIDVSANATLGISGTLKYNRSFGNEGRGFSISGNDNLRDVVTLVYNVAYDNTAYNLVVYEDVTANIYHNWFGDSGFESVIFTFQNTEDVIANFKDNIIDGVYDRAIEIRHTVSLTLTSDYNDITAGTVAWGAIGYGVNKTFAEWKSDTSQDVNSIDTDPLLISSGKLKKDSPAISTGIQITGINDSNEEDIWGNVTYNPPNIGAYQGYGVVGGGTLQDGLGGIGINVGTGSIILGMSGGYKEDPSWCTVPPGYEVVVDENGDTVVDESGECVVVAIGDDVGFIYNDGPGLLFINGAGFNKETP